jgi:hypothetical protein
MAEITTGLMVRFGARQGDVRSDARCTLLMHDTGQLGPSVFAIFICRDGCRVDLLSTELSLPAHVQRRIRSCLASQGGVSSRTIRRQEWSERVSSLLAQREALK